MTAQRPDDAAGAVPDPEIVRNLEKEVVALRRKLQRSEQHRTELEHLKDKDQLLYKKMHAELQESHRRLQETQAQLVQSEKMASLGELTAGIAHEIKNPLNFVNNFAGLIVDMANEIFDLLPEAGKSIEAGRLEEAVDMLRDLRLNAEQVVKHGKRADGIVHSMMEHAEVRGGAKETVALNTLVDDYVNMIFFGTRVREPGFECSIERDYDEEVGEVHVVPQQIGRVVTNLVNNAMYAVRERAAASDAAADHGGPTVSIRTRRLPDAVEVRVADNGKGIPEEILSKVFEPFFTTKPTGTGTGLGLSLAHDIIVQGHGGKLTAESAPGTGATFVITLPV